MNGIPEQVTANWNRAKQAADELTSKYREARIVPCREAVEVQDFENGFESEEPTEPDYQWEKILAAGAEKL